MKKIIFISVLIFGYLISNTYSQVNWVWQNPLPQQNNLNSVFPIDSLNVVAAGDCGMIIRTSDGGNNWNIIQTADTNTLSSVFFVNAYTGWIAGGNYTGSSPASSSVYRTTNAGFNWTRIDLGVSDNMLTSVFFFNSLTGFAGGGTYNSGKLYKSTDGGLSWNAMGFAFAHQLNAVFFLDPNRGWVTYSNAICRTTDAGLNWTVYTTSPGLQSSIVFVDSLNGYYSCGNTYKTTNGGINWSTFSAFGTSINFLNSSTGWIGGASSNPTVIYKTTSSGSSWTQYNFQTTEIVQSIRFANSLTGWGVGWYGTIQKTTDGGLTWFDQLKGLVIRSIYGASFINANTGFMAGGDGYFGSAAKTTTGGANWSVFFQNNTKFNAISFVNENYGWLCGYGYTSNITGKILNTTDGGLNWYLQYSMLIEDYTDVKFFDANTGYVIGYNVFGGGCKVMKTTNGGTNWVNSYLAGAGSFKCFFLNVNTGWIGCENGKIFRTTNQGLNWDNISFNLAETISAVNFLNINTGFAGGYNGGLYKTTDGGSSWTGSRITMFGFNDIVFVNNLTGWAASAGGDFFYTTNQGENWSRYPHLTSNGIAAMPFADQYTGWIIGGNGMVLKTNNCGGLLGIQKTSESVPEKFRLSQNYPNPFNPTTKIKFDVPKSSHIELRIYDILGREVLTLINEQFSPGSYEIPWDASNYSSGMYFYKLTSGDFSETKKMILLK